jgi:hypothetical protein
MNIASSSACRATYTVCRTLPSAQELAAVGYAGDHVVRLLQRFAGQVKCLYLALMSLDPTGTGRQRWTTHRALGVGIVPRIWRDTTLRKTMTLFT